MILATFISASFLYAARRVRLLLDKELQFSISVSVLVI